METFNSTDSTRQTSKVDKLSYKDPSYFNEHYKKNSTHINDRRRYLRKIKQTKQMLLNKPKYICIPASGYLSS